MTRPSAVHINLDALQYNFNRVRQLSPNSRIMAMVKANAYGHGLTRVAKALPHADAFGVACLEEAILIRQAGLKNRIILMSGFFSADELLQLTQLNCDIVVHCFSQIEVLKKAKLSSPLKVWLKIDTGMHRLGFLPEEFNEAYNQLKACAAIQQPIYFMTHFFNADLPEKSDTQKQIDLFNQLTKDLPGEKSLANSAGLLAFSASQADWVRPGIMLYGISPFKNKTGQEEGLKPVMTLQSHIIAVRHLKKGEAVGYGATWQCPRDMPVGVVTIGYGDGYPRHAKNGTPVLVNETICPLAGRVSMDLLTIDLRPSPNTKIGDQVTLWGEALPIEKIANYADTIPYELLCHIQRVNGIKQG